MKLVIAATGASGSIYLQRLLDQIDAGAHEVHLVMSAYAKQVARQEVGAFKIPKGIAQHSETDLNVPYVSGSARFDAMVIVPCSMGTLGRIAHGLSDEEIFDVVLAAAARCFFSKTLDALGVEPDAAYAELDPAFRDALTVGRPIGG